MTNKGLFKTGLLFAILTALGWILFVIGTLTFPQGDSTSVVENYLAVAESAAALMYTWGGILGSLAVIPVFVAFFEGFRRETGPTLAVPMVFAIVGVVFLTLGFMVDTGSLIYYFGPKVTSANASEAASLAQAAQLAQDSIEVTWAIGSFLAYGGAVVWMAILFLRSSLAPKFMNWVGVVGGFAGFVWLVRFIPVPAPQAVGFILLFLNIILVMIWLIGLSLVLVKSADAEVDAAT